MLRGNRHDQAEMERLCREIRGELDEGESFANLARKYSEGANASEGGDQGWRTEMSAELMDVVSKMKPGEIWPDNLKLGNNLYLVRLAEFQPGSDVEMTSDIAKEIRKRLETEEEARRYDAFIAELKMKFAVRRMD